MPAPLPPDQLTVVRNLLAKGDTAGAIKVYIEATGATQAEAKTEVNHLATRYGLIGTQLPDIFMRRTPAAPKPAPPAEAPEAAPSTPPAPAPVAQQAANVPLEPLAPAPAPAAAPAPAPRVPVPKAAAAPARAPAKAAASPTSTPQPATATSTPGAKKSRWGCSSVVLLVAAGVGIAWWVLT
jgi:hypothetical protein